MKNEHVSKVRNELMNERRNKYIITLTMKDKGITNWHDTSDVSLCYSISSPISSLSMPRVALGFINFVKGILSKEKGLGIIGKGKKRIKT